MVFYGVRGFILVSGFEVIWYGGNMLCVVFNGGEWESIVLDLGIGLCCFGVMYVDGCLFVGTAFVSYLYWDYV